MSQKETNKIPEQEEEELVMIVDGKPVKLSEEQKAKLVTIKLPQDQLDKIINLIESGMGVRDGKVICVDKDGKESLFLECSEKDCLYLNKAKNILKHFIAYLENIYPTKAEYVSFLL